MLPANYSSEALFAMEAAHEEWEKLELLKSEHKPWLAERVLSGFGIHRSMDAAGHPCKSGFAQLRQPRPTLHVTLKHPECHQAGHHRVGTDALIQPLLDKVKDGLLFRSQDNLEHRSAIGAVGRVKRFQEDVQRNSPSHG